ncbi:MAG: NAD(P)/FAD-dependent oxidoreductase [Thermodesulfobacteriota bacterium]|nr:NAD(P)/FAD-dependent oxidoreductase [Thermodesulfobacteriota bacterium]
MIDFIIIGGGIVGASMAYELAKYQFNVTLIEKEAELSFGVSKSNSGIIHTGFQDDHNSLKGKFAVRGNQLYREMSRLLDFPFIPTGELVVAFPGERQSIEQIKENGERLGIPGLEILDGKWLDKSEPMLSKEIEYALLGPTAAVINPYEVIYAMAENAISNGVNIYCDNEVTSITKIPNLWSVKTSQAEYKSRYVINAAGLSADKISLMAGTISPEIIPRKGEEFILDRHADRLTKKIIFPVPRKHTKGILLIPTVDGNTMIGPTSNEIIDREDLTTTKENKQEVLKGAQKLAPSINEDLLIAAFAGLRPTTREGDFYIKEGPDGFINIIGIQSPGLTAAPAIAEHVVNMFAKNITLPERKNYNPNRVAIPRFRLLNTKERNILIKRNPDFGEVICRCELVTKGEIKEAIRRGARTLDGIKFRTRSQMGRCHGSFCTSKIMAIMSEKLGVPFDKITKKGKGSELVKRNGS